MPEAGRIAFAAVGNGPAVVMPAAEGVGRYSQEVEAAVYFCVLEALQNVQKYAEASRATVRIREGNSIVHFEVRDDGCSFDVITAKRGAGLTNMEDRLDALGGTLEVTSSIDHGTTIMGALEGHSTCTTAVPAASVEQRDSERALARPRW
jgi:signal transduction histidine kinase